MDTVDAAAISHRLIAVLEYLLMHADHFQHLKRLSKLILSQARITGTTAAPIIAQLHHLKHLEVLDISNNCLNDDFAPHPLSGAVFLQ